MYFFVLCIDARGCTGMSTLWDGEGQQQSQTADILPNQAHSFYGTHAIYHSTHLVSTL